MRAAILAGGKGTRLAPYTTILPKPLVPVGDRPILELILRQLEAAGITRVDLCVGHLGELIRAYVEQSGQVPDGLDFHFHWEEEPLGTAGAIRFLDEVEGDEPMLVMNGDILTTLDYRGLIEDHSRSEAALTIATHTRDVTLQLGVIEGDGDWAEGFVEKPTLHYEVSMGIYVYSREAIAAIPDGYFDLPDLVLSLLAAEQPVRKHRFTGPWYDIGTPGDFERASTAYAEHPELYEPPTEA